ncbi:MAG TPA: alpha/beta hydrolase [Acidimicrobiales bacterium]|nr:alpha/beta hydrolase [Acidimicrobiales bacterium]
MSGGARSGGTKSRVQSIAAFGVAGGLAAAWAAQHRVVRKALDAARQGEADEGLVMPDDLVHHDIETEDGGTIHVVERGRGPVLVLLHGMLLSSETWVHQLTDLTEEHRVLAVDLRGHGRSVPGSDGFRAPDGRTDVVQMAGARAEAGARPGAGAGAPAIARMASDVRRVLEALDVRQSVLVGHSMGGMVAMQLVCDMPEDERRRRISGLVLASTSAGPFVSVPGLTGVARLSAPLSSRLVLLADRAGARTLSAADLRWWVTRLGFGPEPVAAQVQFVARQHMSTPRGTLGRLLPSLAVFDLSARLDAIDLPVLVVVGSRDRLTGLRHARRMAHTLPQAQLVELPRCGHMPMLERPREFSHLLAEFSAKLA